MNPGPVFASVRSHDRSFIITPNSLLSAMRPTIFLFFGLSLAAIAQQPDKKPEPPAKEAAPPAKGSNPVTKELSVEIDGKSIPYKVTTNKIQLKQDNGKSRASIFHVSYVRSDVKDASKRPV